MKKSILITRPQDQAQEIAKYLQNHDFEVILEPIFSAETLPVSEITLRNLQNQNIAAIVITSQNAASTTFETIKKLNLNKNIKIFAVGRKTAQIFLSQGYKNVVFSAKNSAKNLRNLILQDLEIIKKKALSLYFCGEILSLDLQEELAKFEIKLEKIISYKIIEKISFSDEFLQKTKVSQIDFIMIYSKNSIKILLQLLKKHDLFESLKNSKILCLSKNIESFAQSLGFDNVSSFDEIKILKKFYE
ncbi:MAG: uroporphyrinogen-III synthase [Rickettsiales bacterium]|nr:uroporphyrinogen-III synthase [Rickettsiales bacterium]